MIVENEIKKIIEELKQSKTTSFTFEGFDIEISVLDHSSKLFLATPVYSGGNYIPKSVRHCISQKAPFDQFNINTYLTVDENRFQISLNYLGQVYSLTSQSFRGLLEDFSTLAQEWRLFLDEHDKNDLIHVRVK